MKFDPWAFIGCLIVLALCVLKLLLILNGYHELLASIRGLC